MMMVEMHYLLFVDGHLFHCAKKHSFYLAEKHVFHCADSHLFHCAYRNLFRCVGRHLFHCADNYVSNRKNMDYLCPTTTLGLVLHIRKPWIWCMTLETHRRKCKANALGM